jgi:hypothetical protein
MKSKTVAIAFGAEQIKELLLATSFTDLENEDFVSAERMLEVAQEDLASDESTEVTLDFDAGQVEEILLAASFPDWHNSDFLSAVSKLENGKKVLTLQAASAA